MEMAHIRKRNGKWIAEIRKKDFKKIQKTFLRKSNATNWAKEIEYLMDKNQYQDYGDSSRFTLGDLIRKYRDEIAINKKGFREETYKLNLILRYKIVKCRLLELKTNHIYDFKKEIMQNRKASTVNKYLHYIYTIWETAKYEWGMTLPARNPVSLVKREKVKTRIDRILTPQEYQSLINASKKSNLPYLADIIEFAYITAMRFGEITKLEIIDIDFENKLAKLRDTKNGEDRVVPLNDRAVEICLRFRFRNKLFDIKRDRFRHYFEQACRKAEVKNFRFHDLRACAITNLFLRGWTIAEVSVVSGHKTWAELKRYTRIKPLQLVEKLNKA
jgi:integrase